MLELDPRAFPPSSWSCSTLWSKPYPCASSRVDHRRERPRMRGV